jgi:pentatricopeptide repeat protein
MVSQAQSMKNVFDPTDVGGFWQVAWDVLVSTRLELFMFLTAVVGYLILFSSRAPNDQRHLKLKAKMSDEASDDEPEYVAAPKNADEVVANLRRSYVAGDHRAVLRHWAALKQLGRPQHVNLEQVLESMQMVKKDSKFIVSELKAYFKKNPVERDICTLNGILESLSKRFNSQLMGEIVDMLTSLDMAMDSKTYEIFLTMHSTTRSFTEIQRLVSEMQDRGVEFSAKASVAVIKAALQSSAFEMALKFFAELKASWATSSEQESSSWAIPRHVMTQLVELACKEHHLQHFLPELQDVPLPEEAINAMLTECIQLNDSEMARSVETLARAQLNPLPDSTYSLLIKSLAGRRWRMQAVVQEVMTRDSDDFSAELALSMLHFCILTSNKEVADALLDRMKPKQVHVLTAFIRFYVESEQCTKACDIFEFHVLPLSSGDGQKRLLLDARVERSLMSAALSCGRESLVKSLVDTSKPDVAKNIVMIRKCAGSNDLKGVMSIFNSLKESGVELNAIVYNTVLDACVKCRDVKATEDWVKQMKEVGVLDAVSYNTLMKAHLMQGNLDKARGVMEDMKKSGLQPNRVTYNELLNAVVIRSSRRSEIWEVVKEMKEAAVAPNQVTCSILLKNLNAKSTETDILLTMDLIESIEEAMDEVLISSIVEACVRIGKPDLLAKKLQQLQGKDRIIVNGSHTCGSLIKAYGHAKDMEGVWRCWKEMRSRLIKPTSITVGCMVEAIVNNGETEEAYELMHQMLKDDQCSDSVNAIIYCSIMKGFSREKKLQRVWDVYEEMSSKRIEMSLITFNTIIDACARTGRMDHLPKVMQDMKTHHVEPNLITYSTILKGHCQAGDIQRGFSVLRDLRLETNLKPDEIMYNSLLDGCAQNNLLDEGMRLFDEMQKEGISPSNFTLSIMVKLLNRARKLEQAFDLVRDLPQKYNFKPNAHVYTNLIQACIGNRQSSRAVSVFESMVKDRVQPDSRTYSIIIRSCFNQDKYEQAVALLRAALGLPGAFEIPGSRVAPCHSVDSNLVNETLASLADRGCAETLGAPLLADIRKSKVKVYIDQSVQRRVTMSSMANVAQAPSHAGWNRGPKSSW